MSVSNYSKNNCPSFPGYGFRYELFNGHSGARTPDPISSYIVASVHLLLYTWYMNVMDNYQKKTMSIIDEGAQRKIANL